MPPRSQLFGVATKHPSLKLELAFDFNIGDNYGQHLFMNIDTRYPVRHNVPPGRERRACCGYLNQGHGLSPLPQGEDNDAQLFVQTRTLRIRHDHGALRIANATSNELARYAGLRTEIRSSACSAFD
jgi:hypothetical protein